MRIDNLCVFLGSRIGNDPIFQKEALLAAEQIKKRDITLVYGGARMGLMGVLSEHLMRPGGKLIGIVPKVFYREDDDEFVTELYRTEDMAERKKMMIEMSDAFLTLPGGIGTIDEYSELMVSNQLKTVDKPNVLVNLNDFFSPFLDMIENMVENGFLSLEEKESFLVANSVEEAFSILDSL